MGRPEKPIDPQDGPVARFAYELRKLRDEAGAPGYRSMARRTGYSATTLSQAAGGERLPTLPVALAYVRACHGDVEEWRHRWKQVNAEATALPRPSEEDDEPPYRGLERFEPGDAELFFGREETAAQLVEMARRHRLSVVVGASGSGKSSLLRAGLIPQLRRPEQDADERPAAVRVLTPGARPMDRLDLLTPAKGRGDTWVLVDQFEELFTLCACPEDRDAFLERLLAAREPGSRLRVVLALRADFFARCAENHTLAAALNDATLLIGPMTAEQLRAAIVRPAQARGLNVERDLTARLLDEVADEPGALPLMSHALLETWRRRRGHILTQDAYQAAGGLHGAIARTAEDAYHQLTPSQTTLARRILLRLIAPGDGTEDTHRPTPRAEFAAADPGITADTDAVLDRLARARLLTVDEGTVFLAHEKLITAWPRLQGWINEERDRIRLHRQLTHDALAWRDLEHDAGALYRGSRLVQADEAFTDHSPEVLNPLEAAFLDTSVAAGRRHERRTRRTLITLSTLLCLALLAALVAYQQRNDAEQQRRLAVSRELAARAGQLSEQHPEAAMVIALRGYRQASTTDARSSLLSSYARFYANQFTGHTELFTLCACPEDRDAFLERLLAAREPGSRLRVVLALRADFFARCAENHTLAAALNDATLLIGPMTAEQLRAAIVRPAQARGLNVERDLTARLLDEVADEPGALPLMSHALLETWRRRRGHILTQDAYQAAGGLHGAIARTAEDAYHQLTPSQATLARRILLRLIAPGDGTEDTHRPTPRTEFAAADSGATADTDAVLDRLARARLLTVDEGTVFLAHEKLITAWPRLLGWIDEERGRVRLHRQLTHDALVWHKLGRDPGVLYRGSRLVQADEAFTGRSHEVLNPLEAAFLETSVAAGRRHERRTRRTLITLATLLCVTLIAALVAYQQRNDAENQRHLAIARELAARAGQLSEQHPEAAMTLALRGYRQAPTTATRSSLLSAYARFYANQFTGHTKTVTGAAFAPNGHILATASMDHSVKLWDTRSHRLLATLTGHTDIVNSVAFSPDGRTLATAGNDHSVKLWDTHSHRLLATLTGHTNTVEGVAFSPDGRTLASTGMDGTVRLWRPRTHEPLATLNAKPFGSAVVFSPDGRTLASTGKDSTRLWNVTSRRPVATLTGHSGAVTSQASFADRHAILRVDYDISVTHWSTARPRTRPAPIRAPKPFVTFVASSDSTAVAGHDRVIRVWSLATGRRIATLPAGTGMVRHLAITPDGRTLAVGSDDGTIRVWDVAARRTTAVLRGAAARSVNVLALRPEAALWPPSAPTAPRTCGPPDSGQTATPLPGPKNRGPDPWPSAPTAIPLAVGQHRSAPSDEGRALAAVSTDGTTYLWATHSGQTRHAPDPAPRTRT
ncbi:transcriptional regulator, XRE family [Streptomyces iranensis]|uniref:Transcriptional regulator, XRE family n=1 Tax=Streptomyces iranensis TaxID=576784 RepID=A0A060ZBB3_9ACTN|nr:transcriptional regulator, XRE family [Streptomyces iranensis]